MQQLISTLIFVICFLLPVTGVAETVYVEIAKAKLRSEPTHWGQSVGVVNYGDALEVISKEGEWVKTKNPAGLMGFIHQTALTAKRVVLKGKGANIPIDLEQSEIVLAGKGFNQEIESHYAGTAQTLNYEAVDELERLVIDDLALKNFLEEGRLKATW